MVNIKISGFEYDTSVLIVGDIHGQWRGLNQLIARKRPSIVLQVGDFGWWPRWHKTTFISSGVWRINPMHGIRYQAPWNQYGLRAGDAKVYFCPGNHEHWEDLNKLGSSDDPFPVEVHKNTFYMPRCSTLALPDGRNILFMGGALSTDKDFLKPRLDWFHEETITQRDVYNLPDTSIDIVVSHTCPSDFKHDILETILEKRDEVWKLTDSFWLEKFKDPSCTALSRVLDKYEPALWFFGHYHISKNSKWRNTDWFALNKDPEAGWWMYLPKRRS